MFSDSILCLGKILETAEAVERWKGQLREFQPTVSGQFYGIDGGPIEFEWNIFPKDFASLEFLRKIQEYVESRNIDPENLEIELCSCPCSNDIIWNKKNY